MMAGEYLLISIGIGEYEHLVRLEGPGHDTDAIQKVLEHRFGFRTILELHDEKATRDAILHKIKECCKNLHRDDTLVIHYAGHGKTSSFYRTNYWCPYDALDKEDDSSWIPSSMIATAMNQTPARHVLLLNDSCFSGDFFRINRDMKQRSPGYDVMAKKYPARQVVTSGSSEPVADCAYGNHSPFTYFLLDYLENSQEEWIDPIGIYDYVRKPVTVHGQTPRYGTVPGHHEEGSCILYPRDLDPDLDQKRKGEHRPSVKQQILHSCPICGLRNQEKDTFQCRICGREYLCRDHLDKDLRCCEECVKSHSSKSYFDIFEALEANDLLAIEEFSNRLETLDFLKEGNEYETPLLCALESADARTVEFLIKCGADVNYPLRYPHRYRDPEDDVVDLLPLVVALGTKDAEKVRLLLDHGAKVHFNDPAFWDIQFKMKCEALGATSEIVKLLESRGANFFEPSNTLEKHKWENPFFHIKDVHVMEHFFKKGLRPDVAIQDVDHAYILTNAVSDNNLKGVEWLLSHGISLNRNDSDRSPSPLHNAARFDSRFAIFEYLVEHGADVYSTSNEIGVNGGNVLHVAAKFLNLPVLNYLKDHSLIAELDMPDAQGNHPLHLVFPNGSYISNGKDEIVGLLESVRILGRHCDVHVQNNAGKSPIEVALEIIKTHKDDGILKQNLDKAIVIMRG
jgi:ankyrin repeat protein